MRIDITGLKKETVLAALYNGSQVQGFGFLQSKPGKMSDSEAAEIIKNQGLDFDYLHGKVMKVDLSKNDFDPWLYDRDNGTGKAEIIIDRLRK